jgi:hypothetical protein
VASRVFLSSTRLDFAAYRAAVARALREAGYEPIGMEDFGAQPVEPLRASLDEVARADLLVGLYAHPPRGLVLRGGRSCSDPGEDPAVSPWESGEEMPGTGLAPSGFQLFKPLSRGGGS